MPRRWSHAAASLKSLGDEKDHRHGDCNRSGKHEGDDELLLPAAPSARTCADDPARKRRTTRNASMEVAMARTAAR